jgi:hypothetical protein
MAASSYAPTFARLFVRGLKSPAEHRDHLFDLVPIKSLRDESRSDCLGRGRDFHCGEQEGPPLVQR